jgi:FkbM family methyltransferase
MNRHPGSDSRVTLPAAPCADGEQSVLARGHDGGESNAYRIAARSGLAMQTQLRNLLARRSFQPFWEACYKVVVRGMGYNNYSPKQNGEYRVLAQVLRECAVDRPIVFDVGANQGSFTTRVLELVPGAEVHAFEPNPSSYARLAARFAGRERVYTHAVGLSDRQTTLELADYADADGSTHASFSAEGMATILPTRKADAARALSFTSVPVTTLDAFVAQRGIPRIDYLKLDVEGHEREVLLGAQETIARRLVRNLQIEINAHNAVTGFSLYQLKAMLPGYAIYKILPDGLYHIDYKVLHDIYRYANFLFSESN